MDLFDTCKGKILGDGLKWVNEPDIWSFHNGELVLTATKNTAYHNFDHTIIGQVLFTS